MKLRGKVCLLLLGSCLLSDCGGGSGFGGGSPAVSFSTNSLIFGDEVEGTVSEPLPVTLTNSGTAVLAITSIVASVNFAETNNCGPTLAPGANCTINVTLAPSISGSLNGTLSVTDNAAAVPQTVSLSGTGVAEGHGGSCSVKGQQCPPQSPCCSGLVCVAASTRAFCE